MILVLLVLGHGVNGEEKHPKGATEQPGGESASRVKDANDPNELWWSRWDAHVKDPNDPNELLAAKWDAVIKVLQTQDLDQKLKEKIIDKDRQPYFRFSADGPTGLGPNALAETERDATREIHRALHEPSQDALPGEDRSLQESESDIEARSAEEEHASRSR